MARMVEVTIPHELGRDEARRRIDKGFTQLIEPLGQALRVDRRDWNGDSLEFAATALGQRISGSLDVDEREVRVHLALPWLLAVTLERMTPLIRKRGEILLEHKPGA